MSGHMPHLDVTSERRQPLALHDPVVHGHRLEPQLLTHKPLHNFRRLDQVPILPMRSHLGPGRPHDGRPTLRVIPVSMRQPELSQRACLLFQNRFNIRPDVARRIDEHGLATFRRGQ